MKKLRSIFLVTILSTTLVGNVFAGSSVGGGIFSFFDAAVSATVSFLISSRSDGDCPVRVCGNCRPEDRDPNGDCRPPAS
jgi:hypothetical protein